MRAARLVPLLLAALPLGACATGGGAPAPASPLAIRELQSRSYPTPDTRLVMKAALGALQDNGFVVKTADAGLGLITATKESVREVSDVRKLGRWSFIVLTYGVGALLPGPRPGAGVLEATANVSEFGLETRLRVSFELKVLDGSGRLKESRTLGDAAIYQEFFARVDQGLFLLTEKVG